MDPYSLDPQASSSAAGASSPTLQSPMDTSTGFGNRASGGAGKKRGSNVDVLEDDEDSRPLHDDTLQPRSSNSSGLNQPQKRRRKDTVTTSNNNGSNTDDLSSNDDDGSNDGRRRESLVDGKRPERPRLTEEEKKNNHIASEQKRRMAIRDGFDRLTELVPGIEGQGRSESIVLRKTVDYMRKAIEDRRNLIAQVQELGGEVPQDLLLR